MSQSSPSASFMDAVSKNAKIFEKMFRDMDSDEKYPGSVDKLSQWASDQRAYYEGGRQKVLELVTGFAEEWTQYAHDRLKQALGISDNAIIQFNVNDYGAHPFIEPYKNAVRTLARFTKKYAKNPEMQEQIAYLVSTVESRQKQVIDIDADESQTSPWRPTSTSVEEQPVVLPTNAEPLSEPSTSTTIELSPQPTTIASNIGIDPQATQTMPATGVTSQTSESFTDHTAESVTIPPHIATALSQIATSHVDVSQQPSQATLPRAPKKKRKINALHILQSMQSVASTDPPFDASVANTNADTNNTELVPHSHNIGQEAAHMSFDRTSQPPVEPPATSTEESAAMQVPVAAQVEPVIFKWVETEPGWGEHNTERERPARSVGSPVETEPVWEEQGPESNESAVPRVEADHGLGEQDTQDVTDYVPVVKNDVVSWPDSQQDDLVFDKAKEDGDAIMIMDENEARLAADVIFNMIQQTAPFEQDGGILERETVDVKPDTEMADGERKVENVATPSVVYEPQTSESDAMDIDVPATSIPAQSNAIIEPPDFTQDIAKTSTPTLPSLSPLVSQISSKARSSSRQASLPPVTTLQSSMSRSATPIFDAASRIRRVEDPSQFYRKETEKDRRKFSRTASPAVVMQPSSVQTNRPQLSVSTTTPPEPISQAEPAQTPVKIDAQTDKIRNTPVPYSPQPIQEPDMSISGASVILESPHPTQLPEIPPTDPNPNVNNVPPSVANSRRISSPSLTEAGSDRSSVPAQPQPQPVQASPHSVSHSASPLPVVGINADRLTPRHSTPICDRIPQFGSVNPPTTHKIYIPALDHFGPQTQIIAHQRLPPRGQRINFSLDLFKEHWENVEKWNRRVQCKSYDNIHKSICVSLGCYKSADVQHILDIIADSKPAKPHYLINKMKSSWPQEGGLMISLRASIGGQSDSIRLTPPLTLTPEGNFDLGPYLMEGKNKINLIFDNQTPKDDYFFVLLTHLPTRAQMQELKRIVDRDSDFSDFLAAIAAPFTLKSKFAEVAC
ncbi:hypothetical protein VNI00_008358 [Paramarasmius palmivorus]|uniref:Uncharacterized protein n=1 Tax=Paramarasmius palmivorus TaxID=297713 RepID=A0AAW0CYV3_9AGAR